MKKPASQVVGDIPPQLVTEYCDILAIPLHYIFSKIYETLEWPEIWKRETVTVIPKVSSPTSLSELRNLSCTPLFSKLLESFVLEDLKGETSLSEDQYGGIKGSGPDHFLLTTWQEILEGLGEEDGAAATLTSIDFAKAFNRMSHQACLTSLKEHGASVKTISLVSAFLCGRAMSVRIGTTLSDPRPINGGSPQGSILGNYLFCMTTDNLGARQDDVGEEVIEEGTPAAVRRNRRRTTALGSAATGTGMCGIGQSQDGTAATTYAVPRVSGIGGETGRLGHEDGGSEDSYGVVSGVSERGMHGDEHREADTEPESSNDGSLDGVDSDGDYDIRFFRFKNRLVFYSSDEDEIEDLQQNDIDYLVGQPENWVDRKLKKCIYIDDYNCIEKVRQRDGVFHLSTSGRTTVSHAAQTQVVFNNLKDDATKIGMQVNDRKTNMLCMSASKSRCTSYLVTTDGTRIESSDTLKLLGFVFDRHPNPQAQIDAMVSKFRKRLWCIRYLKKSGLSDRDLCQAYVIYLRPVLEYSSITIHSMLTKEQTDLIDKQQSRALKIIFGFDKASNQVHEMSGLEKLSLRRSKAVDRFALKIVANPKFTHLFPLRPEEQCRARQSRKYVEKHARTSRLYNRPVFYMRRRLNDLEEAPAVAASLVSGQNGGRGVRTAASQRCDFIHDEWR